MNPLKRNIDPTSCCASKELNINEEKMPGVTETSREIPFLTKQYEARRTSEFFVTLVQTMA